MVTQPVHFHRPLFPSIHPEDEVLLRKMCFINEQEQVRMLNHGMRREA